jgi:hypothetical protein
MANIYDALSRFSLLIFALNLLSQVPKVKNLCISLNAIQDI